MGPARRPWSGSSRSDVPDPLRKCCVVTGTGRNSMPRKRREARGGLGCRVHRFESGRFGRCEEMPREAGNHNSGKCAITGNVWGIHSYNGSLGDATVAKSGWTSKRPKRQRNPRSERPRVRRRAGGAKCTSSGHAIAHQRGEAVAHIVRWVWVFLAPEVPCIA